MNDKFTERVRRTLFLAREEAIRLHAHAIGTEHILLGLLREGEGVASTVLRNMGIEYDKVRVTVQNLATREPNQGAPPVGEVPLTSGARRVLELAVDEARQLNHDYIGTEHLLLGLSREGEGLAAPVLDDLAVDWWRVRDGIRSLLAGTPPTNDEELEQSRDTPNLNLFSRDLTRLARQGKLDPILGREEEIERVIRILCRRTKNSPVLIGEPGVGRTAIVRGLARRIVEGRVPEVLRAHKLIALDLTSVIVGAGHRGEVEERLKKIMREIRASNETILFIEQLYAVVGAGGSAWAIDASNMFRPAIIRGELQCIGTMTPEEYGRYIERDGAFDRRFEKVPVETPTREETILILGGLREKYEAHHRVRYLDDALALVVDLVRLYLPDYSQLQGVLDVIDAAGARGRRAMSTEPDELRDLLQRADAVANEKDEAIRSLHFERAAGLRDREKELRWEYFQSKQEWRTGAMAVRVEIGEKEIQEAVSEFSGIPVSSVIARAEIPVRRRITSSEVEIRVGHAFVLIPHGEDLGGIYDAATLPALESNGLQAAKAEDIYESGSTLGQAWSGIRSAEVIVADVSGMDAGVIYALGLCHGLKRSPILLVRDPAELPFDLRSLRSIQYEDSAEGVLDLKRRLTLAIQEFLAAARE